MSLAFTINNFSYVMYKRLDYNIKVVTAQQTPKENEL